MARPLIFVLGTRPEIIKLAPLIAGCQAERAPFVIIHTGQHYDASLDAVFFDELSLPAPEYNLGSGSNELPYPEKLGLMVNGIEAILRSGTGAVVLVQGDTTSALAGALAAKRASLQVAHLEAGLRSRDYAMTEEWNRIMIDEVADHLFPPTEACARQLIAESADPARIHVVGNSIVDAVHMHREAGAPFAGALLAGIGVTSKAYALFTMHRAENTDSRERLEGILEGVAQVSRAHALPIVLPLHPRTRNALERHDISLPPECIALPPQGYVAFLQLMAHARLIITDSGGMQEEASILHVPCVTVRDNTERPETIHAGVNALGYATPERILLAARAMLSRTGPWPELYGNGTTAAQVLALLAPHL